MKKYLVLLFGLFLFVFVPQIHAQPQVKSGFRTVCLDAKWCKDDGVCPSTKKHVHRTALSTQTLKAVPSSPSYIFECVAADPDPICTTGNSELDILLTCPDTSKMTPDQIRENCDGYWKLTQDPTRDIGYDLRHAGDYGIWHLDPASNTYVQKNHANKDELMLQSDGQGNLIPVEWQSYTKESRMRKFLVYNTITGTAAVPQDGSTSQTQGTLPFTFRSSDCSGNAYDPYGIVFDMMTLEPIPNVEVTLKQFSTTSNAEVAITNANPFVVNPFKTSEIGYFTFYVVDGNYTLTPAHSNYTQASLTDVSLLPVNANRIYSDFYYSDSPVIRQRGNIEHRDIVMKPNASNPQGYTYPLEMLDETRQEKSGKLIYSGYLSHPFVLLDVEICTPGTPATCTFYKQFNHRNGGPDKTGKFVITLDQSLLDPNLGQYFNMKFTKQDLVTATLTQEKSVMGKYVAWVRGIVDKAIGVVHAQDGNTIESKVEPIPVYLEGFAYDNEGSIIPNATVGVYMYLFSGSPMYETTADANGFFRITTENIPSAEYSLRFTSPENAENISYQSTSQFLANNSEFLTAEKINPYKSTNANTNPRRNITPSFVPQQKISPLVTEVSPTAAMAPSGTEEATTTTTTSRNPMYLIGAVLLILLGGAGVMLAVYVYKKRSSEDGAPKADKTEPKGE